MRKPKSLRNSPNITEEIPLNGDYPQKLGILTDRLVSLEEIRQALPDESIKVFAAQYYLFGGTGSFGVPGKFRKFDAFAAEISNFNVFIQTTEKKNRQFIKENLSRLTFDQYKTNPEIAAIVKNTLVAEKRINFFNQIDQQTKMIYSFVLEATPKQFQNIKEKLKRVKFFEINKSMSVAQPTFVQNLYSDFQKTHYESSGIRASADDFGEFLRIAREKYGINLAETNGQNVALTDKKDLDANVRMLSTTWWPAGTFWFFADSYDPDMVEIDMTWGTQRLDNLRNKAFAGREAIEFDFALLGIAADDYAYYRSWSALPYSYDDCPTAGVDDPGSMAMGFGAFSTNWIDANRIYTTQMVLYRNWSYPSTGTYMPSNFYMQNLHCRSGDIWLCGLTNAEKESSLLLRQADMSIRAGQNAIYRFGD